jgi:D-glutamate N-acetyltransferase
VNDNTGAPKPCRLVILTEGCTEPVAAKTAACVIRYGKDEVVALLDSTQAGKTSQELLGVGGSIPVVARLEDVPSANALLIGIAPAGGRIPAHWRPIVLAAIARGCDVISGMHEFFGDDPEFAEAARRHGVQLIDVRKNTEHDVANRKNIRSNCLRILTVGQDCSVGKMVVSVELARALQRRGYDAKFVATGQTGILIEGDGCPVDCVVSDFLNGAVEKLVLANQHHDILLVEGQGSITHPRYSPVTLGLVHGAMPHGMILCYEAGREAVRGMEEIPLTPLAELRELYETLASVMLPSRVIGVGLNSRCLSDGDAAALRDRVRADLGLPVCDVIRDGPDELIDAVLNLRASLVQAATP